MIPRSGILQFSTRLTVARFALQLYGMHVFYRFDLLKYTRKVRATFITSATMQFLKTKLSEAFLRKNQDISLKLENLLNINFMGVMGLTDYMGLSNFVREKLLSYKSVIQCSNAKEIL